MRRGGVVAAALWLGAASARAEEPAERAPARAGLVLAPGPTGGVGALLVAGPVRTAAGKKSQLVADFELPDGLDPAGSQVALGGEMGGRSARLRWQLATGASGVLDLRTALGTKGSEATALGYAVLRVERPLRGFLSLGVDDGVVAYLDGQRVLVRDVERAAHPDDDLIPLDLAPGDHPLLLKLHQRSGAWTVRLRVTDEALEPARGVSVVVPGEIDAERTAEALLDVSLVRGLSPRGLEPRLRVRASGGFPRAAGRAVSASAQRASGEPLFAVQAGELPVEEGGPAHELTVRLPSLRADELGDGEVRFELRVGPWHRQLGASARAELRAVLGRAAQARQVAEGRPAFLRDPEATVATLEALSERLVGFVSRGDTDAAAQLDEAAALGAFVASIERQEDPFLAVRGARRVAYRSPLDGHPSTFGLYVPPRFDPAKKLPLVVALHGMNGKPLNMMRWVFGRDDDAHDGEWEDRHPGAFPEFNAIVVTPMAHFNSMYRYVGEADVMAVVDWVSRLFPVDPERVSITGPSMGGTGTAWVAFRYPDRFAAAAPLCGYHSYFLRGDMAGKGLQPWERRLAEERSTISWAVNGLHLPLYVVHGTRDLPVENSGVLIDRYKSLGYSLLEEHPDEGHNVWQPTYEDLKGLRWLTSFRRTRDPARVALRTDNLRYDRADWVHLLQLERSLDWGEVSASRSRGTPRSVELTTRNVAALELAQPTPLRVKVDGTTLEFAEGEPVQLSRRDGGWARGFTAPSGLVKRAGLAGPLRDVHLEPIVLVYGTSDPRLTRANEQVARWFAGIRPGFEIDYPVVADVDFDPAQARGKALVLVGGPQSNLVTRALDERLPIHVTSTPAEVRLGAQRFTGDELGAAFIYPNPDDPARYVVVLAGTNAVGTLRIMSLPDLLPDYVVFDRQLAPARGQLVLGRGQLLAGGVFDEQWRLPSLAP